MNPIRSIIRTGKPLTFFHTRVVTEELLFQVIKTGKSIELDISSTKEGTFYIGHHPLFYKYHNQPKPNNISIEKAVRILSGSDIFIKFDCKDVGVLDKVAGLVRKIGNNDRCMLHAYISELYFMPYPRDTKIQPHWEHEKIPLDKMLQLKKTCGDIPLEVSCSGTTKERLLDKNWQILDKLIELLAGKVAVVNLKLPGREIPQDEIIKRLYKEGLLVEVAAEKLDGRSLPVPYYGNADDLALVSVLRRNCKN